MKRWVHEMRASEQEQTGGAGLSEVTAKFQRLGWGPVPNPWHDLGTDLFVQARDERLFDRGLIVGVQVKAGASWFRRPEYAEDGSLAGWWYYEPDTDHFDAWVRHGLPHLLVLHDLGKQVSYWVHVTAQVVQVTGQGAKVLVPASQTLDVQHRGPLLGAAATHKPRVPLEGSAWVVRADSVAPAHRLRHALLVPRLVAPHPNVGVGTAIGPEEAVALLVQCRMGDLERFADAHRSVPRLDEAASSNDWGWRFVRAIASLVLEKNAAPVLRAYADAPTPAARAAAAAVAACALMDTEQHAEAVELLSDQRDDVNPVDWAWLLTQRARARAEIGAVMAAREDAAAARRHLVGDGDDVTASAIGAAAAWLLYQTAAWGEEDLDETITAMDTAAAWWRNQTLTSALIDATTSSFRDWANDRSVRVAGQETTHNKIFSVLLSAGLTGDHGTWRTIGSVLARHTLVTARQGSDNSSYADALDELRRSGDNDLLILAAKRLWATGPLDPLVTAASRVQQASWTHTSARANLALWQVAGDVLDETTASSAARRCVEILSDSTAFNAATNPSFEVSHYVSQALSGLVRAADDQFHRDIAASFIDWPQADSESASALAGVAGKLRASALGDEDRAALRIAATRHDRSLANAILGALADDDVHARAQLLTNVAEGDTAALLALGRPRYLPAHLARQEIARVAHDLDEAITQAIGRGFAVRGIDSGRNLALLNISFPDAALWDPVVRLLADQRVPGEQKRDTCLYMARHIRKVPDSIQAAVRTLAPELVDQAPVDRVLGPPVRGPAIALAATVGALGPADLDMYLAELLTGHQRHQRADAALVIAALDQCRYATALTTLAGDIHIDVRAAAAFALAMRVAKDESHLDQPAWSGLQQVIAQPGVRVPLEVCRGIAAVDAPADRARQITRQLLHHQSATIRYAATEAISGYSHTAEARNESDQDCARTA